MLRPPLVPRAKTGNFISPPCLQSRAFASQPQRSPHFGRQSLFLGVSNVGGNVPGGRRLHSKLGSCQGVSSSAPTWSKVQASAVEGPTPPPAPLCKARRQRRDIETSRTSVCPCAGEGTGARGTPPRQRRAPRTGRRRLASRKRVKCWLRMLLLFKELGRRVTSATTASSATSQDKAPENFIKKPRFGNSRQVRPTGRLLPQTGAAADVSDAPVVPGPGSTP